MDVAGHSSGKNIEWGIAQSRYALIKDVSSMERQKDSYVPQAWVLVLAESFQLYNMAN